MARICWQDGSLTGVNASADVSTEKNLSDLVTIGQNLLKAPRSRVNLQNGKYEPTDDGGTNEDALKRYLSVTQIRLDGWRNLQR